MHFRSWLNILLLRADAVWCFRPASIHRL
jgi:hypothetical protein